MNIVDQVREARIEKAIKKSEVAKQIEVVEEIRLEKAEKKSKDAKEMEVAEEVEDDTMEIVDREKEVAEATSKILTKSEEPDKKKLPTKRKRRTKLETEEFRRKNQEDQEERKKIEKDFNRGGEPHIKEKPKITDPVRKTGRIEEIRRKFEKEETPQNIKETKKEESKVMKMLKLFQETPKIITGGKPKNNKREMEERWKKSLVIENEGKEKDCNKKEEAGSSRLEILGGKLSKGVHDCLIEDARSPIKEGRKSERILRKNKTENCWGADLEKEECQNIDQHMLWTDGDKNNIEGFNFNFDLDLDGREEIPWGNEAIIRRVPGLAIDCENEGTGLSLEERGFCF